MSSIKDVAKLAKTSTATVSRVINKTGYVSDEMKKKVMDAVDVLNYKALQREGTSKKTKTIAFVTPDIENPFYGKLTKIISKIANELKYNILLVNVSGLKNDGDTFLMSLIDTHVDGVIYASSYRLGDVIGKAKENKIPLVILDREYSTYEVDSVTINNNQAGYLATEHLIKLGHTEIAYIGGTEHMEISESRQQGYKKALRNYEVVSDEKYIVHGDFSLESGYEATKNLLAINSNITAIVAGNDLMAIGAVNYLNFKGYKIPKDISIVGFDDIDLASSLTPKLTTISYPLERLSELAMESILKQISNSESSCESVSLYPTLVVRDSTGKASETNG